MCSVVVALDVGGTNARARVAIVRDGGVVLPDPDTVVQARSASELYEFAAAVVRHAREYGDIARSVVAVAGPIVGTSSRMSNWSREPEIDLAGLEHAGLPAGATDLVNDVVAGAWGARARMESRERPEALSAHPGTPDLDAPGAGNLLYLAPGTGLGASALIHHGLGDLGATAVGCEAQHTQIPRFADELGQVVALIEDAAGAAPSWEDLVSGRGLVRIRDAIGALGGGPPLDTNAGDERAAEIAAAALAGSDQQSVAAVNVFYRALGHFAQMLALVYLPCAVVVIGGASTEYNLPLVRASRLAEIFATHGRFSGLLGAIPLYTVGGDVNLEGGIWLAAHSGQQ